MIPNLIGISGPIGSGKDTLALILHSLLTNYDIKSFGGYLKQYCAEKYNIPIETFYTQEGKNKKFPIPSAYRHPDGSIISAQGLFSAGEVLQIAGMGLRKTDPDFFVRQLFYGYHSLYKWIIPDVRFINEAENIRERGGILIRLEGDPSGVNISSNRDRNHISETELKDYQFFDVIYKNIGTKEDLKDFAKRLLSRL